MVVSMRLMQIHCGISSCIEQFTKLLQRPLSVHSSASAGVRAQENLIWHLPDLSSGNAVEHSVLV